MQELYHKYHYLYRSFDDPFLRRPTTVLSWHLENKSIFAIFKTSMLSLISNGFTKQPILYGSYKDTLIYAVFINESKSGIYFGEKYSVVKDYVFRINGNVLMSKHSIYLCTYTIKLLHTFSSPLSNIKVFNDRVFYMYERGGYGWYDLNTQRAEDVGGILSSFNFNNPIVSDACDFQNTLVVIKNNNLYKILDNEINLNQQGSRLTCNDEVLIVWDIDTVYYTTNLNEFGLLKLKMHATDIFVSKFNNFTHFFILGFPGDQLTVHYYIFDKGEPIGPFTCLLPHGDKLLRRSPKDLHDLFSFNSPTFLINQILDKSFNTNDLQLFCFELPKEEQALLISQFKTKLVEFRTPVNLSSSKDNIYIFCRQDCLIIRKSSLFELLLHKHANVKEYIPNFMTQLPLFYSQYNIQNYNWQLSAISKALSKQQNVNYLNSLIPNPNLLVANPTLLDLLPLIEYLVEHIDRMMRSTTTFNFTENSNSNSLADNVMINLVVAQAHELNFCMFVILGICCKLLLILHKYQDLHLDELLFKTLVLSYKSGILEWFMRHYHEDQSYLVQYLSKMDYLAVVPRFTSTAIYSIFFTNTFNWTTINRQLASKLLLFTDVSLIEFLPKYPCFQFISAISNRQAELVVKCASYLEEDGSISSSTPMRGGYTLGKCVQLFKMEILSHSAMLPVDCHYYNLLNYIKCVHKYGDYIMDALMPIYINKVREEVNGKIPDNDMIEHYFDLGKEMDFNYCLLVLINVDNDEYYRDLITTIINTDNMEMLHEFHNSKIFPDLLQMALSMYDKQLSNTLESVEIRDICRLFHVICRLLLINMEMENCVDFIAAQQSRLARYKDIHAYDCILQGVKLKQACLCVLGQEIDLDEINKFELEVQYFIDNKVMPKNDRQLALYCQSIGDVGNAWLLDKASCLKMEDVVVPYKGLLFKSFDAIRIEIRKDPQGIRDLRNCHNVPLYMVRMKNGDAGDLIQICMKNGYEEEAKELVNKLVLYTNIGLHQFKNIAFIGAVKRKSKFNLKILFLLQSCS